MKVPFIILFVLFSSAFSFSQEVKWKIDRSDTPEGRVKYKATLTQSLTVTDCVLLTQAFQQKEGIKVLEIVPGTNVAVIQATSSIRPEDIRDIIVMTGFQVEMYNTNPQSNR